MDQRLGRNLREIPAKCFQGVAVSNLFPDQGNFVDASTVVTTVAETTRQ